MTSRTENRDCPNILWRGLAARTPILWRLRFIAQLISVIVPVAVMVGCDSGSPVKPETSAEPKEKTESQGKLFAVSFQTMNNPFFVDLNEGLKKAVEERGDRLVTLDAQYNSLKQKNDVSDILQQEPAVIFVNPVNWEGVRGTLIEAKRRNVAVVIVDAPVEDADLVLTQVASDNVEAGRLAARALAEVNPNARIGVIHYSVNKACIDRVDGFTEVVKTFPGMSILSTQDAKGTSEATRPVMRDLLGRFPELDAVFPINDPGAIGCVSAIEAADRAGKVTVVTVDGSREAAQFILDGRMHSTSAQFPKEIGKLAAEAAYDHLAGKTVVKEIKVPVKLVTKANAQEFLK